MSDTEQDPPRPTVSDGKIDREIWRPEDGNGDDSLKTYESTQYGDKGHPTWKLYCGDAPEKIEGVLVEPPKNCYLDDRAAYKILNWDGYTKAERGRFWRNDFSNKGEIRPHRKHRGRPAFVLGGDIAHLQGGAHNKALARLMPSTNIPPAQSPIRRGAGASKQLKRFTKSTSPNNSSSDSVDFDRQNSPFRAELQDPSYVSNAKRPRLDPSMRSTPSKPTQNNSALIADLKNQNIALTERNETISAKARDLTRENGYLQTELTSTKTLWTATSKDLSILQTQYLESQHALRHQVPGEVNLATLQATKNDMITYRNLAKQLFGKLQSSAETVEKGVVAVNGVKNLARELGITPKEEMEVDAGYGGIQGDINSIRARMKAILGDEWNRFEREVFAEKDD
ncbi:cell division protein [Venturia nashicola]|nr:cell division protein [Venturia nashicola]